MTDEQAEMTHLADSVIAAARGSAEESERLRVLLCAFYATHGERALVDLVGIAPEQVRRSRTSGHLALATGSVQRIAIAVPDGSRLTEPPPRTNSRARLTRADHEAALSDCAAALADGTWSPAAHAHKHKVSISTASRHREKVLRMLKEQPDFDCWNEPEASRRARTLRDARSIIAAAGAAAAATEQLRVLLLEFADAHGEQRTAELLGVRGPQLRRTRRSGRLALSVPSVRRIAGRSTGQTPQDRRIGRMSAAANAAALADCRAALAAGTWSPSAHAKQHCITPRAAHYQRQKVLASSQPEARA